MKTTPECYAWVLKRHWEKSSSKDKNMNFTTFRTIVVSKRTIVIPTSHLNLSKCPLSICKADRLYLNGIVVH